VLLAGKPYRAVILKKVFYIFFELRIRLAVIVVAFLPVAIRAVGQRVMRARVYERALEAAEVTGCQF
jgi:hypothetical protein